MTIAPVTKEGAPDIDERMVDLPTQEILRVVTLLTQKMKSNTEITHKMSSF